jgi:membrane fusion protein (multidrug efflux system)
MKGTHSALSNGRVPAVLEPETLSDRALIETTAPAEIDSAPAKAIEMADATTLAEATQLSHLPKAPRRRPLKLILAAAGVGAIAAGAAGFHWWQYASSHAETDTATVSGHIHQISTRVPGNVQQVLVNDNQDVKAGQVLVRLDPRDYQVKLQQAQSDLATAQQKANSAGINIALSAKNAQASGTQSQGDMGKARAAISQAQAQMIEVQAGIPRAQAQLAASQANLQKAQSDLSRFAQLYHEGAIAQREMDSARQAYQVAQAQVNADTEQVRQAEARLAQTRQSVATAQAGLIASQSELQQAEAKGIQTQVSQSDYNTAKAAIAQAQSALQNAQLQLSYANITAPANGRIGRKTVEVGQQIQPGTPLMALVSNEYWVTANFKETQLEDVRPGQRVEIKLDSFPHKTFVGRVDSISPASGAQFALLPPDNATGNFTKVVQRVPVKVVFDANSIRGFEPLIAPGMSATVTVDLK